MCAYMNIRFLWVNMCYTWIRLGDPRDVEKEGKFSDGDIPHTIHGCQVYFSYMNTILINYCHVGTYASRMAGMGRKWFDNKRFVICLWLIKFHMFSYPVDQISSMNSIMHWIQYWRRHTTPKRMPKSLEIH